ncbi:SH3 domain-containing protein [Ferrimonas gelatinilytica]|uniref:SH3 domain-containing protein n=1 Tax=Ferrimonas gelatinilytica TaxID=1255257 RepID=A0ABP9SB09_9GAMM
MDYIDIRGETGMALCSDSARELNAREGETLRVAQTLTGWLFAINADGEPGWVPGETVSRQ